MAKTSATTADAQAPANKPPRVFISYSHDSDDHRDTVLALAFRLREEGLDAWIDRFEPHPQEGWPLWMERQIDRADIVLLVCTETYRRRFDGEEEDGKGLGVGWEAGLVRTKLYESGSRNNTFVAVVPEGGSADHVPALLRNYGSYRLSDDYDALYRRLTGQAEVTVPPVGDLREMPARHWPTAGNAPPRDDLGRPGLKSDGSTRPASLIDVPADHLAELTAYLEWIARWVDQVQVFAPEPLRALEDVYVEIRSRALSDDRGTAGMEGSQQRLEELVERSPQGAWTLQGDPGSGKSTALRHLAHLRAERGVAQVEQYRSLGPATVPLLVSLVTIEAEGDAPAAAAAAFERDQPGHAGDLLPALRWAVKAGRALVLLDGWDEVDPVSASTLQRRIGRWENLHRESAFFVASRRFGYRRPSDRFAELELVPLPTERQRELLTRWLPQARVEEVLDQAAMHPAMQQMAGNPFLLTLMALLARDTVGDLPTRRVALYRASLDRLLPGGGRDRRERLA